jgi:hypothetical protein
MFKRTLYAGLVLISAVLGAPAMAIPVTGSIDMYGGFTTDSGDLGSATLLAISPAWTMANSGTGSFAPVGSRERAVTFSAFTFSPALPGTVEPLWSFMYGSTAYSFVMTGVEVRAQSSTQLSLFATGVLYVTGFDPTDGYWEFSGFERNGRFKFTSESTSVPEPGTLTLIGLGLLGVGLGRRFKAR